MTKNKNHRSFGSHSYLAAAFLVIICVSQFALGFELRPATDRDVSTARKILFKEAMNPLSLRRENMLVAVDDKELVIGFGQIRPLDDNFAELASLFVVPDQRKKGIGGALVQNLLEKHRESFSSKVCLLTLKPTASFYQPFGFEIASAEARQQLPSSLQNEFMAGSAISFVLGNDIICMIEQ